MTVDVNQFEKRAETFREEMVREYYQALAGLKEQLEIVKERWRLLAEQKRNYNEILYYAEKHPDLGLNVHGLKVQIIECEGKMRRAEMDKERLRNMIYGGRPFIEG